MVKKEDKMLRVMTNCPPSGYVGGQLVITQNILSSFFTTMKSTYSYCFMLSN